MPVYLVACELQSSNHSYDEFHSAIGGYDGARLLDGAYLIEAPADPQTLHRHLAALAAPDDRIWVSRVTEDHSGYVRTAAADWLQQRRPL